MLRFCLVISVCLAVAVGVVSQTRTRRHRTTRPIVKSQPEPQPTPPPTPDPTPEPTPEPTPFEDTQDAETLKIDTNLVTVPIIATTVEGNYIPDLRQDEVSVSENGEKQEVAFFATVSAPFHVVLLLDTSGSSREKIGLMKRAAYAFLDQLQSGDRVKVISFDDQVRDLGEFSSDRTVLKSAINKAEPGKGTKLYDAVAMALSSIRKINGRKAIVLFSDGVDYHSDEATFEGTLHWLDEESVIVYPIRYETRADTARIMQEQIEEQQGPQLPTRDVVNAPAPGSTAPTFPSDNPDTIPTAGQRSKNGPFGLPSAAEIMRRRREAERDRDRDRNPDRYPSPGQSPTGTNDPRDRPGDIHSTGRNTRVEDEQITGILNQLYLTADSYLIELANKSGGRVVRADTLGSLPDAFSKIAAELRTQYAIGYYPTNKMHDGQYRKIKVTTTRKNVAVRARPGYRARRVG